MITHEHLKEIILYDADSGVFTWRITRSKCAKKGAVAGAVHKGQTSTYYSISIYGVRYLAHRLAWFYFHGTFPIDQIDHIDGDGFNNAISNLRDVSNVTNGRNARLCTTNTSGITGVWWDKKRNKWCANIYIYGRTIHLGGFIDIADAAAARKAADRKYGFHENHGSIRHT